MITKNIKYTNPKTILHKLVIVLSSLYMDTINNTKKVQQVFNIMNGFSDILLCLNLKNEKDDYQVISVFKEYIDFMTGQLQIPPSRENIRFHILFSGFSNTSKPIAKFFITMCAILDSNMTDILDARNVVSLMKCLQEYDPDMDLHKQLEFFGDKDTGIENTKIVN